MNSLISCDGKSTFAAQPKWCITSTAMYEIKSDQSQNLLLMRLEGYLSDQELKEGADLCIAKARELKKGFSIINDISKMKLVTSKGADEILRAQSYVVKNGVGTIIRVVDDLNARIQFKSASNRAGYTAIETRSIDEAYELINLHASSM